MRQLNHALALGCFHDPPEQAAGPCRRQPSAAANRLSSACACSLLCVIMAISVSYILLHAVEVIHQAQELSCWGRFAKAAGSAAHRKTTRHDTENDRESWQKEQMDCENA